jgi:hypothetical protein
MTSNQIYGAKLNKTDISRVAQDCELELHRSYVDHLPIDRDFIDFHPEQKGSEPYIVFYWREANLKIQVYVLKTIYMDCSNFGPIRAANRLTVLRLANHLPKSVTKRNVELNQCGVKIVMADLRSAV